MSIKFENFNIVTWNNLDDISFAVLPGYFDKAIVIIDHTKVSGTTHTDFPVLINLSDLSSSTLFDICRADGGDIRVTLSDGTELAREIVSIDTTAGTGEMWVKIPTLSGSVDTEIWIRYNGVDTEPAADSTYGSENVWDNNYLAVYHMEEDPSGTAPQIIDSTGNGRDGTSNGSMTPGNSVTGQIENGLDFDGVDDFISIPNTLSSEICTLEYWAAIESTTTFQRILHIAPSNSSLMKGVVLQTTSNAELQINYYDGGYIGSGARRSKSGGTVTTALSHYAGSISGETDMSLYINGTDVGGSYSGTGGVFSAGTSNGYIGAIREDGSVLYFNGIVDEVRISSVERSADWIATEYNNQSSPSTFYSVFDETEIEQTATPVLDPTSGSYESGTTVSITCSTSGSAIYYTTDGSDPDETDTEYTSAIELTETTTIKAIAVADGYADSEIASETYTIINTNALVTQEVLEVLRDGDPDARLTQEVLEVLRSTTATDGVNQPIIFIVT